MNFIKLLYKKHWVKLQVSHILHSYLWYKQSRLEIIPDEDGIARFKIKN